MPGETFPLLRDASAWRRPIEIGDDGGRLVLEQRPTLAMRAAVWLLICTCAFMALFVGGMFFGSQAQRLVCDRGNGACELNGRSLVAVDQVKGAELGTYWNRSSGHFKTVTLLLRDGSKLDAITQGAQSDRSVAEYRAAVEAIRGFVADPARPRLDVTYTYRASVGEKIFSLVGFVVISFAVWIVVATTRRHRWLFDAGELVVTSKPLFGRATTSRIPLAQIGGMDRLVAARQLPPAVVEKLRALLG
jgi:hypothetical protein